MKTHENQIELYDLAKKIIQENKIITAYDNEETYIYQNGYFQKKSESILKEIIDEKLQENSTTARVTETLQHIKRKTYMEREQIDSAPLEYINLENCVYDLKTKKTQKHTWNFMFCHKNPIQYDSNAKQPKKILEFIRQLVGTKKVKLVLQMFAYCLYRSNPHKNAFMLYGNTDSGKTTLLNLLTEFLGPDNISNIELQVLDEDRFAKSRLYGKQANVFDDLPSRTMTQTGVFKTITGNGIIEGEEKFKGRFAFKPYAKLIFATNQVPKPADDTDAYFNRWIIINFPNSFEKKTGILEKIVTEEQLQGLLKLCLEKILPDLLENGFDYPLSVDEKRQLYLRLSDPGGSFLSDFCEFDSNYATSKKELYDEFEKYCRENKHATTSEKAFSQTAYKMFPNLGESRLKIPLFDKRERCWVGIRLLTENSSSFPI